MWQECISNIKFPRSPQFECQKKQTAWQPGFFLLKYLPSGPTFSPLKNPVEDGTSFGKLPAHTLFTPTDLYTLFHIYSDSHELIHFLLCLILLWDRLWTTWEEGLFLSPLYFSSAEHMIELLTSTKFQLIFLDLLKMTIVLKVNKSTVPSTSYQNHSRFFWMKWPFDLPEENAASLKKHHFYCCTLTQ